MRKTVQKVSCWDWIVIRSVKAKAKKNLENEYPGVVRGKKASLRFSTKM